MNSQRRDGACPFVLSRVKNMISRLLLSLVLLTFLAAAAGFAALAMWDVPVTQTPVDKVLESGKFVQKS